MGFRISFSEDALVPNVLSAEMYNLLIFAIGLIFVVWMLRLCKGFISMAQLVYVLRSGRFNILNIANFDRIDNLWGEGSVRSFIQALFRGNVSSPSVPMRRINDTLIIQKNSLKIDVRNLNAQQKCYGVTFKFDSLVASTIQLFWGVKEHAFNQKVLIPFKNFYNSNLELNENGEVTLSYQNNINEAPAIQEETLLDVNDETAEEDANIGLLRAAVHPSSSYTTTNSATPASSSMKHSHGSKNAQMHLDLNNVLDPDDYISKTQPRSFAPALDNIYVMQLGEMIAASSVEQYFTSLPLHRRSEIISNNANTLDEANNSNNVNADNENGDTVLNVQEPNAEEEEEAAVIVDDDNDETNRITLPLVIVLRATARYSSPNALKRTQNEYEDYEEESICVYCIAYFQKTNSNLSSNTEVSEPQYTIKVYKNLIQTETGLYEMQDIFGTSEDNAGETGDEKCIICWDNDREVTLLPCRHMCVCQECFQQIDKCPICRQNTTSYIIMGHEEYIQARSDSNQATHDQPYVERLL